MTSTLLLSSAASAATVDALLKDLKSASQDIRQKALDELADVGDEGFTEKEALQVIAAAGGSYAPTGKYSINAELVSFLRTDPSPKLIQPIVNLFPKLDADARWYALDVLTRYPKNTGALKTYLGLVGKNAAALDGLPVGQLKKQTDTANLLFPALLQYTKFPRLQYDIYDLILAYAYDDQVPAATLRKYEKPILNDYAVLSKRLQTQQQNSGIAWRWEDPYLDDRYLGGILLDLMGFFNTKTANTVLKEALAFKDPYLKGWAAISMVYNDQEVPEENLHEIAASNEMRWTLFDYLQDAKSLDLFPDEFRNQRDLGASDLANQLLKPDALGYEPESIEFVQKFTRQSGDDLSDYYLYRFTDQDGVAYAGLAGPYSPAKVATVTGGEDTYSLFEKWDDHTPEEHYKAFMEDLYYLPDGGEDLDE
ncbi:hypothetical protein [Deinococcus roseus]|uniref:HEAT repeat domain-containing protein n=1 Tax=Deinococcus roseus TaxID=392414 RepID=A0ABQ2D0F9_9DEIO|nr:hypothetical protein [Deinococcus roseus]GGJ38762.1 hypothetical protein GCM10008938_26080 [Deinococcus roseus]